MPKQQKQRTIAERLRDLLTELDRLLKSTAACTGTCPGQGAPALKSAISSQGSAKVRLYKPGLCFLRAFLSR